MPEPLPLLLQYRPQPPFLYGSLGDNIDEKGNVTWTRPFIISKAITNNQEHIYGSLYYYIDTIKSQVVRFAQRQQYLTSGLSTEQVEALQLTKQQKANTFTLPNNDTARDVLDGQELNISNTVLVVAVHLRNLLDMFGTGKDAARRVKVLEEEDKLLTHVSLRQITNAMIHDQHSVIYDSYITNLMFDADELNLEGDSTLADLLGLRVNAIEFLTLALQFVNSITVNDLIGIVRRNMRIVKDGSFRTKPSQVMLLVRNAHSFGRLFSDRLRDGEFCKIQKLLFEDLFNEIALVGFAPKPGSVHEVQVTFKPPRVFLHHNAARDLVVIAIEVNGVDRKIEVRSSDFFSAVSDAYGRDSLVK